MEWSKLGKENSVDCKQPRVYDRFCARLRSEAV